LTWVSEGNDFRRLRVISKAGEVVEIMMLAYDMPPLNERPYDNAKPIPANKRPRYPDLNE
jgi:hypothetical protein